MIRENERPARVVIASDNGPLAELASRRIDAAATARAMNLRSFRLHRRLRAPQLDNKLNHSDIEGYVWLDEPAIASRHVVFRTRRMGDLFCAAVSATRCRTHSQRSAW